LKVTQERFFLVLSLHYRVCVYGTRMPDHPYHADNSLDFTFANVAKDWHHN